jgi:biotin carboxylase
MFNQSTNKLDTIVLVGAGILQIPAIKIAQKMGLFVICTDHNPKALGFEYCDKKIILSAKDVQGHIKLVNKLSKKYNIRSIFTQGTDVAVVVAETCNKLNLPSVSVTAAKNTNNKIKFRRILKKYGIQNTKFSVVKTKRGAYITTKKIGLPVIIKSIDNSGGRGAKKITHFDQINNAFKIAQTFSSDKKTVLVEEWLEGDEYSVETIQYKNKSYRLGIADRIFGFNPYPIEIGHVNPSQLDKLSQIKLYQLTERVAKVVGVDFGAAKSDAMITKDGRFIILEMAARLSGGFHSQYTTPYATGMNIIKAAMDISLGRDIDKKDITKSRNKIIYCIGLFPDSGKVSKIIGLSAVKQMKGIRDIIILVKKGDIIKNYRNSADRVAYIISEGNSFLEAKKYADNAIKKLKIITH